MGSGRFDSKDWGTYTTSQSYSTKSAEQIYEQRKIHADLNPKTITLRESRDSVDNPRSTPIIVGLDVTGSMQMVLAEMAKEGLNTLMTEVYARRPVSDPHLMVMAVGDAECDAAPLQVSQFEADIRIAHQLEKLYLEKGGGGNQYESYTLPWYFATHYTALDSFEKRGEKGFLFTVGDENPPSYLDAEDVKRVFGRNAKGALGTKDLLAAVSEQWNVFHLIVAEGNHAKSHKETVKKRWADVLGQRAVWLADHRRMAQVIVSLLQLAAGMDTKAVQDSWDPETKKVIRAMDLTGAMA